LTLASYTLLDKSTAQVGVYQTTFRSLNCFEKSFVANALAPCISNHPLRQENTHESDTNTLNYSTVC